MGVDTKERDRRSARPPADQRDLEDLQRIRAKLTQEEFSALVWISIRALHQKHKSRASGPRQSYGSLDSDRIARAAFGSSGPERMLMEPR